MASSVAVPAEEPYTPVSFKGASHALKLRASFATSDRLRVEAGYDLGLNKAAGSRPWGSLLFQLDPNNKDEGFLEVNNDTITVNKSFQLKRKKLSVGLDAKIGVTTKGQPSVTLGIDNVPLMLVGAAVMLALKKPISVTRKETGGLSLDLPFGGDGGASYALQERAEVDCTLRRQGRGVSLAFQELNGMLRLRHDKASEA